jgi:uncharacterized protein YlaI
LASPQKPKYYRPKQQPKKMTKLDQVNGFMPKWKPIKTIMSEDHHLGMSQQNKERKHPGSNFHPINQLLIY